MSTSAKRIRAGATLGGTAAAAALSGIACAGSGPSTLIDVAPLRNIDFVGTTGAGFSELGPPGAPVQLYEALSMMQRNMGNGAAVGDYDGDGDLDVYLLGSDGFSNVLYRNRLDEGIKSFEDATAEAEVGDLGLSRVAHFVDLDNDGHADLLLINDNDETGTYAASKVYRNDGDGTFTDVTAGSGFTPLGHLRCGASLADYDLDGLLDIYVTNWSAHEELQNPPINLFPGSNRLYRNLGNFTFEDVTDAVGLGGLARDSFTAIFHDFTEDGLPDLHVAVDHTSDEFYLNNGPDGFERITELIGTTHIGNDMGVACADFDDDGDLDMYATNITGSPTATTEGNCFYYNVRDQYGGTFFGDVAFQAGIEDTFWGWGVDFFDPDNDGDLDLFAVTGFEEFILSAYGPDDPMSETPMVEFINEGGWYSRHTGFDYGDDSRALVVFDYDRDGDEDLLVTTVNGPARLLENFTPNQGHWLGVAVEQTRGNRGGIGATVFATIGAVTKRREILAGESYLAGTPAEAHFGLGTATTVDELRVRWTDGTETVLSSVAVDQFIVIAQPELGDLDGSGAVDFGDLTSLLSAWGPCPVSPGACPADLDGDGQVAFPDLSTMLANWG